MLLTQGSGTGEAIGRSIFWSHNSGGVEEISA
jgi:hypothetical protein